MAIACDSCVSPESHALSFFHLSSPDFLLGWDSDPAKRNVFGLIEANPDLARAGIRLRQFGQTIIELLGARKIHSAWTVPGGVRSPLSEEGRQWICDRLPESLATINLALGLFKGMIDGQLKDEVNIFGEFPSLFMGYGNTIRGDDGAGSQVAETVGQWNFNHVRSLAVHQLTPDLVEAIAQAKTVIFVDAVATLSEVKIEQLRPNYAASFTGHYTDPRSMLALTYTLYEAIPTAYRILIPAVDFSFGETLSPVTQKSVDLALVKIKQLVSQQSSRMSTAYKKSQPTRKESYMETSDRLSHSVSLEQRIYDAIAEVRAISAQYGSQSRKSAAAWDIVEELQPEAAHQQAKHSGTTAFTDYCEEFPDAPEARL